MFSAVIQTPPTKIQLPFRYTLYLYRPIDRVNQCHLPAPFAILVPHIHISRISLVPVVKYPHRILFATPRLVIIPIHIPNSTHPLFIPISRQNTAFSLSHRFPDGIMLRFSTILMNNLGPQAWDKVVLAIRQPTRLPCYRFSNYLGPQAGG